MKSGECLHLNSGFLCTEGKYQNYPCPYMGKFNACPCSIPVTDEMERQWKEKGCVVVSLKGVV